MGNTKDDAAYAEQNRASWNAVTAAHNSHKSDQAAFLRAGGSTLYPEERELLQLQPGMSLLHLQCNCGQDTLSLAQLGAKVTGVDISDKAIEFAQNLSRDSQIEAVFERSDVYDWLKIAADGPRRFDRVFSSYGAIGWLGDLHAWAQGIARLLTPGGQFVLVEFHPILWSLVNEEGRWSDDYFSDDVLRDPEGVSDYVGRSQGTLSPSGHQTGIENFENPEPTIEFQWTVSEVITAVLDAGLRLRVFKEYPYSNGCLFISGQRKLSGNRYGAPPGMPNYPQMFAIVAQKPA